MQHKFPLGGQQQTEEQPTTKTEITFDRKFKEGTIVSGMYFSGSAGVIHPDVNGFPYYEVTVSDKDPRIDGRIVLMYEAELHEGTVPTFDSLVYQIRNKDKSDTKREKTFGEYAVGLDLERKGIDAIDKVWMYKNMCADLIDEMKIDISLSEKEDMILIPTDAPIPTYINAARLNVRDQLIAGIDRVVKLKHRLVSAVTGNNDKIS